MAKLKDETSAPMHPSYDLAKSRVEIPYRYQYSPGDGSTSSRDEGAKAEEVSVENFFTAAKF